MTKIYDLNKEEVFFKRCHALKTKNTIFLRSFLRFFLSIKFCDSFFISIFFFVFKFVCCSVVSVDIHSTCTFLNTFSITFIFTLFIFSQFSFYISFYYWMLFCFQMKQKFFRFFSFINKNKNKNRKEKNKTYRHVNSVSPKHNSKQSRLDVTDTERLTCPLSL